MQQQFELSVTLRGATVKDLIEQARSFTEAEGQGTAATTKRGPKGKQAAPTTTTDETEETLLSDETEDGESFDLMGEESSDEVEEKKPVKKAAKKVSDKDVNEALKIFAKEHGFEKTKALLQKNFGAKSILELKPEQYETVIAKFKVK